MTLVTTDFRVKFDQMGKISLMRVEGQLTDESLPELYEVSRRYSDAIDARVSIVDLSSVSEFDVSSQSIWKLARQKTGQRRPTLPVADVPVSRLDWLDTSNSLTDDKSTMLTRASMRRYRRLTS